MCWKECRAESTLCFLIWGVPGCSPEPGAWLGRPCTLWVSVPTSTHSRVVPGDLNLCSLSASMCHSQKEKMGPRVAVPEATSPRAWRVSPRACAPPSPARAPTVCVLIFPMQLSKEEHSKCMGLNYLCKLLFLLTDVSYSKSSANSSLARMKSLGSGGFRAFPAQMCRLWSRQVGSGQVSL